MGHNAIAIGNTSILGAGATSFDVVARRLARRLFFILVPACLALYLTACSVAENALVFPGSLDQGSSGTRLVARGSQQFVHLSLPDGTPIAAMFGPALDKDHKPVKRQLFFVISDN